MVTGFGSAQGDRGGGPIEPGLPHRLDTNLFLGEFLTIRSLLFGLREIYTCYTYFCQTFLRIHNRGMAERQAPWSLKS